MAPSYPQSPVPSDYWPMWQSTLADRARRRIHKYQKMQARRAFSYSSLKIIADTSRRHSDAHCFTLNLERCSLHSHLSIPTVRLTAW